MSKDIFEIASKQKFRFPSKVGLLSAEDLWDLPLVAKSDRSPDLNSTAIMVSKALKESESTEEDFVGMKPVKESFEGVKLEIVKHVIAIKKEEMATKQEADNRRKQKELIASIIAEKQDGALREKSLEELQAMMAE